MRLETWVADEACCPANKSDWAMPRELESAQGQQGNKAPDVKAVGRRVKPAIQRTRAPREMAGKFGGGLADQAPGEEVGKNGGG